MNALFERVLSFIYPPQCIICQSIICQKDLSHAAELLCGECGPCWELACREAAVDAQEMSAHDREQVSAIYALCYCDRCGEVTTSWGEDQKTCVVCFLWPPPVRRVRSLWRYSDKVKAVVKGLKYGKRRRLARYLGAALCAAIAEKRSSGFFSERDWDLVVPIPSSAENLRQRGFHHMALVAREVARGTGLTVTLGALKLVGLRPAQASLPIARRHQNMQGAFHAEPKKVLGKTVLLLDDVMTTGASIFQAASSLLEAGALHVDALTVSRACEFQSQRLVPGQAVIEEQRDERVENY